MVIVKALRMVLLPAVVASLSCTSAQSTAGQPPCPSEPARRMIQNLNQREWSEWTVSTLTSAFPDLRTSSNSGGPVRIFYKDWANGNTGACD